MDDDIGSKRAARKPRLSIPLGVVDNTLLQGHVDYSHHLKILGLQIVNVCNAIAMSNLGHDLRAVCFEYDVRSEWMAQMESNPRLIHILPDFPQFYPSIYEERDKPKFHQVGKAKCQSPVYPPQIIFDDGGRLAVWPPVNPSTNALTGGAYKGGCVRDAIDARPA